VPTVSTLPDLAAVRVAEVMHRGLVTCRPQTSLRAVAGILAGHRIHAVVVAEARAADAADVWGVLSDLDLIASLAAGSPDDLTAGAAAVTPACLVAPGDTLDRAARLMVDRAVAHLIVVDPLSGHPVGILSTLDVAGALAR
jgi:CBS domain-containing protein